MIVFSREQDKAQRNALQLVVKQTATRNFRAGSALEASGQDWEDLGITIAGRSLVRGPGLILSPSPLYLIEEVNWGRSEIFACDHLGTGLKDMAAGRATNADLAKKVDEKTFRSDLYYRLNVFPLTIPPLRELREDIPPLVHYFVQKYAQRMKKAIDTVPPQGMKALLDYHWPGNVRELENFIERAVIISRGSDLVIPVSELKQQKKIAPRQPSAGTSTLEQPEREHILRVLKETKWVIGGAVGAAARLGMKRTTLQSVMRKLGIARPN